ncbi:alpha/beta fold hydrolase [Glycomyces terrestris]|uniref:Alpha/beta hydrolase n=1 Tax=Glycomyces terrestris TaxID=2493553 RepID=A0A426UT34_9ACTN|nr:alpha/beta hydrolase [Glycomyces terrestris]RRR96782.1 alpha/beta hydrolase [Glycomyces terrestris]
MTAPSRRTLLLGAAAVPVVASLAVGEAASAESSSSKPTVVLVHGAFADASGWNWTIRKLHASGYRAVAVANPLRALASDTEYVKAVLASITGPVVLVGHSYGGAVITNAAAGNPNVKALVYIAAFAPEEGESAFDLSEGGILPEVVDAVEVPVPGGGTNVELSIRAGEFRRAFIDEVTSAEARAMAAMQRPVTLTALGSPSGPPAWKTIPSWYAVFGGDQAIPAASQRSMAERAGSTVSEYAGASHAYFVTRPGLVFDLVRAADRATRD